MSLPKSLIFLLLFISTAQPFSFRHLPLLPPPWQPIVCIVRVSIFLRIHHQTILAAATLFLTFYYASLLYITYTNTAVKEWTISYKTPCVPDTTRHSQSVLTWALILRVVSPHTHTHVLPPTLMQLYLHRHISNSSEVIITRQKLSW
jgi:hypothetical protein